MFRWLVEQQYLESGPMFFLTPPTVAHSFVTEADADGHVLTVRQTYATHVVQNNPPQAVATLKQP